MPYHSDQVLFLCQRTYSLQSESLENAFLAATTYAKIYTPLMMNSSRRVKFPVIVAADFPAGIRMSRQKTGDSPCNPNIST